MADFSRNYNELSPAFVAVRTCLIVLLGVLIVAGNILSITVTRRVTNLADSTKVLMTALAAYDLLVGFMLLLNGIVSGLNRWPFGNIACTIWACSLNSIVFLSLLSIISLNVDRYIAITKPYKFPVWCTKRRTIVLVFILSMGAALVSILGWLIGAQYFDGPAYCYYRNDSHVLNILGLLCGINIPSFVMTGMYYRIVRISRQHELRDSRNQNEGNVVIREHKALKTFLVVLLTFSACYMPQTVRRIVEVSINQTSPAWLQFLTIWLIYSNSAFNVFIYCLFNQAYRQTAKKIIKERLPCLKRSTVGPVDI